MESLQQSLASYYLEIKTLHLLAIALWSFSTAVAYRDYVVPAFSDWLKKPDDLEALARRDWVMERFDRGAQLEHVAFPIAIITGLCMIWIANWPLQAVNWLSIKLAIMLLIFVPVEIVDYHLAHFGGNKKKLSKNNDPHKYQRMTLLHWNFLRITAPVVVVFIPLIVYLAVVKPVF
jgi:uncharacterized membrane protein